jgi:hypothetical protein
MDRDHPIWNWRIAALLGAAVAVAFAAGTVHRGRYVRARRLGVSVIALTNPERLLKKLRSAGL